MSREAFLNRVRKMGRHWDRWARKNDAGVYRIYDRDIPGFPLAIDRAGDYAIVQLYAGRIPEEHEAERLEEALECVALALGLSPEQIIFKQRERQRGRSQYERQGSRGLEITVSEGGLHFLLKLSDYLDIGLFADHRITRGMVRDAAAGAQVLNLFAYTGSFTVYAAAGGAAATTTVDMSRTYIEWSRKNLALNGFSGGTAHRFIAADVLQWIGTAPGEAYDIIVLDPPSFSNSKRMEQSWDVQRDHGALLDEVYRLLRPGGRLIFSTNKKAFRLQWPCPPDAECKDITRATTPPDFQRHPRQQVFQFSRAPQ